MRTTHRITLRTPGAHDSAKWLVSGMICNCTFIRSRVIGRKYRAIARRQRRRRLECYGAAIPTSVSGRAHKDTRRSKMPDGVRNFLRQLKRCKLRHSGVSCLSAWHQDHIHFCRYTLAGSHRHARICSGFASLLVMRLLIGMAEAPCFPTNSRVVAMWFQAATSNLDKSTRRVLTGAAVAASSQTELPR
jgi:hypothetical protein